MPDADTARYYLRDLGYELREMALEAKREFDAAKASTDAGERDYRGGYLMGFHAVISLMQQQAVGFGIPLEELSLDAIDPDNNLT